MRQIKIMLALVLASVCSFQGARAETDVTNQYLQDADLMSLGAWSYGDNGHTYTDWRTDGAVPVIEHWNATKTFHLTQEVTLPAGAYRFTVNAFYREGDANGTNNNAYMVIGDNKLYVHALTADEAVFNQNFSGSSALLRAASAFSEGYYNNTYDFTLDEEQTLTMGVRGTITTANSWFIHGPFKLYQLTLEDFLGGYRAEVAKAEALYAKPMNATVLANLQAAVVAESTLTTSAAVIQATGALKTAITSASASVSAYARLLSALNEAKAYAVKCYANGAPETNAIEAYETAYNNGTVADSDVDANITALRDIMKELGLSQASWQRIEPTMPRTLSLESGKVYYLYNVGSDRFFGHDTQIYSYPWACTDQGKAVRINLVNGTQYTIMFTDNNRFMAANANSIWSSTYSDGDDYRFTITEVEGGYTIQRVADGNANHFIGYDGRDGNYLGHDLTSGNIVWQLFDEAEAARFIAQRNLYRALASADGYNVDQWELVYDNDASSNYALQTAADELNDAIAKTSVYTAPSWSDYPILFSSTSKDWGSNSEYFYTAYIQGETTTITATFETDEEATLVYDARVLYNQVYLDDILVTYNNNGQAIADGEKHYIEMRPGKHVVKWVFENYGSGSSRAWLYNVGIEKTPTITVSLLEPGSLGTEVLKYTDHIQNVRKLVVSGPMNSDDWERLMMMNSLFTLDLTNAEITEIPARQLSSYSHSDNLSFFHAVKLPLTLKTIGDNAFKDSDIDEIEFHEGLTTIGQGAFSGTRISQAIIPETVISIGERAFESNYYLTTVSYPAAAKAIPYGCFDNCVNLQPFEIPEGITSIGNSAFYQCYSYRTGIPASVSFIDSYAFNNCNLDDVVIRENVDVRSEAFEYCKLKTIEFPTSMYSAPSRVVKYCTNMTDIYLKSPTMVTPNSILEGCNTNSLTVHVPDYLVNTYKQDKYWYNYNIVGFSTADVADWFVKQPLKMSAGQRFEGTPNVKVCEAGTWQVSGDDAMTLNNFETDFYNDYNGFVENRTSQILSTCDNIQIAGDYTHYVYTTNKRWFFITLPFDTKVGDIGCSASFAIRYYDGANRAENGSGGNWKNYTAEDVIPAGTGFIFQTSQDVWTGFKAQDNASKQYVFQNKEFVKALEANDSESTANKGWNLVGNPWMTYYNIHKLNFTAPITVWNAGNRTYSAYSIIDDDYAIKPNEAFFVQCPDEVNNISFPVDGRQLTSVIESQNAVKALTPQERTRWLIDVELTNGEQSDKTRFVLNEAASMGYEMTCDASKFFSMDTSVPQIYTIENGEQLAINERPLGGGFVKVGIKIASDGNYSIHAPRCQFKQILLVDNETGMTTDIAAGEYTFTASAGTYEGRFELRFSNDTATGINEIDSPQDDSAKVLYDVYDLSGRKVPASSTLTRGVYIVNGKKVMK